KLVNIEKIVQFLNNTGAGDVLKVVLAVDEEVDTGDLNMVAWQLLGNSDPLRDHRYFGTSSILFDGTVKAFRQGGFPRPWPDIVCSDEGTITSVDEKWSVAGMGNLVNSPSLKYLKLRKGNSATVMP
ncbi:MAG TPA: UbiD family decarboxylase, partial [Bacteroidales bacterium]|nr:UbiD family decarboxylase [Bacteroidales bacterium]